MSKDRRNAVIIKLLEKMPPGATAREKLAVLLSRERYVHSLGTASAAVRFAADFGADADAAYTAGLIHDCAKDLAYEDAVSLPFPPGFEPDELEMSSPALLHGPAGAALAARLFGLTDTDILGAVRFHVTGRPDARPVDLAVKLADAVEPSRDFPGVNTLRDFALEDPAAAVVIWVYIKIEVARRRGLAVHRRSDEMLATVAGDVIARARRLYKNILDEIIEAC